MQKKGQMTIYVVVGLIVLASLILLLTFKETLFVSQWEKEREQSLAVPDKVKDLQEFMLSCIKETTIDGLNIMGIQGGYITLPSSLTSNPKSPFSRYVNTFKGTDYKTAYWFYKTPNSIIKTDIPSINQMNKELSSYLENNLGKCTLNFSKFEQFNVTVGDIAADAKIRDNAVLVTVTNPILVSIDDFNFRFERFYQKVNSNYGTMYKTAKALVKELIDNNVLEDFTIDILSVNKDIPYSGTIKSCTPKFWNVEDIITNLKSSLESNIAEIKVKGTRSKQKKKYYNLDLLDKDKEDLHINFRYSKDWPLYLEVYPSEDGVLKAEPLSNAQIEELAYVSSYLCLLDYNFIYDIVYPVVIILSDNEGYSFQFATHVIIDNNQPKKNLLGTEDFDEQNTKICENAITPINVFALDADNNKALADAQIKLKCVTTVCNLGKTSVTSSGNIFLKTTSPACVNAKLTATRRGYHTASETVNTLEPGDYSLFLDRFRTLKQNVKIIEQSGYEREPEDDETIILTLVEKDKRYSTNVQLSENKVRLIPGHYNLKAYVSKRSDEGFYIEGKKFENCVELPEKGLMGLFFGAKEEHCYSAKSEDMSLNDVLVGGADFEFDITSDMLDKSSKVTFYIPTWDIPKTQEDMITIQENINGGERVTLPEFEE